MSRINCTCFYCNHIWEEDIYTQYMKDNVRCPKCKDKNIKFAQISEESKDVFGYNKGKKDG